MTNEGAQRRTFVIRHSCFVILGHSHRAALGVTLGLATLLGAGCGMSGMSEDDVRAMAIRRADDEEEIPAQGRPPAKAAARTANSAEIAPRASQPPSSVAPATANSPVVPSPPVADVASGAFVADPAASPSATPVAEAPLSDTRPLSAAPLAAVDRHQASAQNLQRIIAALVAHQQETGVFPKPALADGSGAPGLSWRVAILPQLGYANLYHQFHLSEPWNSPHNMALLKHIPAVYQSPDRFDEKTNYLLPVAGNAAFLPTRALRPRDIEDGVEHTVFLVEVDDELAVPWTQPRDYPFNREQPVQGLGKLRGGQIFLAWGNGSIGSVPLAAPVESLRAMFTADAGEAFSSSSISRPLDDAYLAAAAGEAVESAAVASSAPDPTAAGEFDAQARPAAIAAPPTSALAESYAEAARAAYRNGDTGNAMRWYYASLIAQPERQGAITHRWVAGLRRPLPTVHFGVGLLRRSGQASALPAGPGVNSRSLRDATRRTLEPVGSGLLDAVESHAQDLAPASFAAAIEAKSPPASGNRRRGARQGSCPVSYFGEGSPAQLRKLAIDSACDILVLFEAAESPNGASRSLSCQVLDVARNETLSRLPQVYWLTGRGGVEALNRNKDFRDAKWRLDDLLQEQLAFGPWPDALQPRHAAARMGALAETKGLYPLAALAEMCVYRDKQLIDNRQLLAGFRGLLGDEDGETLMLGDERARGKLLRRWLPTERPGDP